ncbi:hypothetical protein ANABIO32_00910 [Rossellomorea marisflavi]|nr:hypothetical protein ANABIO32_00910 [Rossellomorea marisflavi]
MLQDLLGFCRRNLYKLNERETEKMYKEINTIKELLEKKMKGAGNYVG